MKVVAAVLLASAALTLAGGGTAGSAQRVALQDVCNARARIAADVATIKGTIVAPGTPMAVLASLQDVGTQIAIIRSSQAALPPALAQQVKRTTTAFIVLAVPVVRGLSVAPSGEASLQRYKIFTTAQAALARVYANTFGTLKCP
jgi:hypothetical protein